MKLLQRTLATLSATGTAALMTLPVLAQSAPMNNGMPANSSNAVDCSYITGGIGGPIDTQNAGNQTTGTQAAGTQSPSSYDTASSGVQGNTQVPLGNASTSNSSSNQTSGSQISGNQTSGNQTVENQTSSNQTSSNQTSSSQTSSSNQTTSTQAAGTQSPSSYDTASSGVQGNTQVPLGNGSTSTSNMSQSSNQGNMGRRMGANTMTTSTYNAMMQVTRSPDHRQFDANNYSAAVAFRRNGIAATSGHEALLNLNAYQQGRNALAANNLSASTPLPVACRPQ